MDPSVWSCGAVGRLRWADKRAPMDLWGGDGPAPMKWRALLDLCGGGLMVCNS